MQELTTSAQLVEYETLTDGSMNAVFARSELEATLHADESAGVWFEFGYEGEEETRLLTIELATADIEKILGGASGDDVALALDADAVAGLFDDSEVEAHGLRGALAIAVTTAAIVAPASLAASPQTADAASTAQRASAAATAQQASAAATAQRSSAAATAQRARAAATTQVSSLATRAQVSSAAAKRQINRKLVVKAGGVTLMRSGLAR